MFNKVNLFVPVFANDLDAYVPEIWANESIAILLENMVIVNLIHRDFSDMVANYGDVVNTRKPSTFTAKRKGDNDEITVQDATATNIPVALNQHFHVSFIIKDSESSKSFKDLVSEYLEPAIIAHAQTLDKVLLGQAINFVANSAGGFGEITTSGAVDALVDLRRVMNVNKCPEAGRNLILGPTLESIMLKNETFHEADKVGDAGTALAEASLGRKLGFNIFMSQNMSEFTNLDTQTATTVAVAAIAGATTVYVADVTNITAGDMVTIAGDMTPQRVVTATNTSVTGGDFITIAPGIRDAVAIGAAVTIYDSCLAGAAEHYSAHATELTSAATYSAAHYNRIYVDGFTANKGPQLGQMVYIGVSDATVDTDHVYTIIDLTYTAGATNAYITLDRPLSAAVLDNAVVSLYPTGNFGFAFNRNCMTFVSRPLALPKAGAGVLSAIADYNGVGMRVCISYDPYKQGHLVTVDLLCGVKVLDTDLGAVLLG